MKKLLALICSTVFLAGCYVANAPAPVDTVPVNSNASVKIEESASPNTNASVEIRPQEQTGDLKVKTSEVTYFETTKGFLAQPETPGDYPGVVMIHEWWGLNDNIKNEAEALASHGYNVLAVDLYNGKVAATPDEARGLTGSLDQAVATKNLQAATKYLRDLGSTKMASLGWCFGGKQSLQLALSGEKLDATVIYYGQLETDATKLTPITWPVLGVFGDKDASISVESVKGFEAGLNTNKTSNEIYIYPGVGHAFANPSNANYAATETADAWAKTLTFLEKNLK